MSEEEGVELQEKGVSSNDTPTNVVSVGVLSKLKIPFLGSIVGHWLFDTAITGCIVFNMILMAAEDPKNDCDGKKTDCDGTQEFIYGMEFMFLAIYIGEAIVKILGLSWPGYIGDHWNKLDLFVVLAALVSQFTDASGLSVLRTVRLLRALRALHIVPSMKKVANTLISSIPVLGDVLILCIFMLIVFTVFGLQLFMGTFRQQCVVPAVVNGTETYSGWAAGENDLCSNHTGFKCSNPGEVCMKLPEYIDGNSVNPEDGNYHYDNFGMAFLTVFLLTTAEGWTGIMYQSQDTTSDWAVIYYLLVIWLGTLVTISLALAALESVWGESEEDDEEGDEEASKSWSEQKLATLSRSLFEMEKKFSPLGAHTELGRTCKVIVRAAWFENFILVMILANTVTMGMVRADASKSEEDVLEMLSWVFLGFFSLEMVMKLCGLGFTGYTADTMNMFDGFIVTINWIEIAAGGGGGLSVFRAFRMGRMLKLAKSWKSLRRLVIAMVNSAKAASSLTLILALLMFIFALLGKEFFAYSLPDRAERYHYDNFGWSLITVFVVLSGENWNALMFDAMSGVGRHSSIYFVMIIILGGYIILNLFIAIILDELMNTTDDEFGDPPTVDVDEKEAWIARQYGRMFAPPQPKEVQEITGATPPVDMGLIGNSGKTREELLREKFDQFDIDKSGVVEEKEINALLKHFQIELTMLEYHVMFADERFSFEEFLDLMNKYKIVIDENMMVTSRGKVAEQGNFTAAEKEILKEYDLDATIIVPPEMKISEEVVLDNNRSLGIFGPNNRFRLKAKQIAEDPNFNNTILFVILASTVCVAVDEPGSSCSVKKFLNSLDFIFTIVFCFELVVKVIAMGAFTNKNSYWRSSNFNKLDAVVVAVSLTTVIIGGDPCETGGDGEQIGALKALRAFRALRPLRTVGRIESLRVVVNALMQSILPIINVLGLMAFFFLVFAILGVQMFAGKFNYCNEIDGAGAFTNTSALPACPEVDYSAGVCADGLQCTAAQCMTCYGEDDSGAMVMKTREWATYHQNFDNTIQGMVVLFEMATLEAWPSIALYGVDTQGTDKWPDTVNDDKANMGAFAYFILFILIGTFFVANLFASVACDKYENMSQFYSGMLFLTETQKVWVIDSQQVWKSKPKKVANLPIVKDLELVATSDRFDGFILSCILVNIMVMCVEYEDQSKGFEEVIASLNYAFIAIFTGEMIIKNLGVGPEAYFNDNFNCFDAVIVILSWVALAADLGSFASIFRIFRITKVLKMLPKMERLMSVVMTVYHSLPALFNVALLTALFFLIFACLGMSLFGEVIYGAQLSRHANFETFPMAMLTLFRVATGEDWNGMMYDCAIASGDYGMENQQCGKVCPNGAATCESSAKVCPDGVEPCGCGIPYVSQVYFIVFNVLAAFVMLNVVVAAILTHFDLAKKSAEGLSDRMINSFKEAWWSLDPDATARIQVDEFEDFYKMIAPTFGFDPDDAEGLAVKCEVSGGELRFSEVLYVCAFEKFGHSLGATKKARELENNILKQKVKLDNDPKETDKPIHPQITEAQLADMTPDELRQQLMMRGHVRLKNRSVAEE